MSTIAVIGAGAFGTALAQAQARHGRPVRLWGRDGAAMDELAATRQCHRLPGVTLDPAVSPTGDLDTALAADVILLALPAQALRPALANWGARLGGKYAVACCKGIDLETGEGPMGTLAAQATGAVAALLTGPSFAADIARGLPTALTLAADTEADATALQTALSTPDLRLYRSTDPRGAELGGALKNVVAIAAGLAIGTGFGDSARAAVVTRGFAEIRRLALALGARAETLAGLSGFGDLVLTCTAPQSRNFAYGVSLGQAQGFDPSITVEGAATARAVLPLAARHGIDLPIAGAVAAVIAGQLSPTDAARALLTRPLKPE